VDLPLDQPKSFQVYKPRDLSLAVGDHVRATKNVGECKNNELYCVQGFENGYIELVSCKGGKTVTVSAAERSLYLDQGIVVTSHSSQGKSVDQVMGSVPVSSLVKLMRNSSM
jgi:hypothetical protein